MQLDGTKLRLLVADDNSAILQEICDLTSREFELVATACDGLRLLAAAKRFQPDIVVTDINMPRLNGIDASRQMLQLGCCKAVVLLSAINDPEMVKAALGVGVTGYVLKENAGEELIPAIRSAVNGKLFLSSGIQSLTA